MVFTFQHSLMINTEPLVGPGGWWCCWPGVVWSGRGEDGVGGAAGRVLRGLGSTCV